MPSALATKSLGNVRTHVFREVKVGLGAAFQLFVALPTCLIHCLISGCRRMGFPPSGSCGGAEGGGRLAGPGPCRSVAARAPVTRWHQATGLGAGLAARGRGEAGSPCSVTARRGAAGAGERFPSWRSAWPRRGLPPERRDTGPWSPPCLA